MCDIGAYLQDAAWKSALESWIQAGGKLVIYDSSAFAFPFTTENLCQCGSHNGSLSVVEENTLSSAVPESPYFINTAAIIANTDAVGDASVMTTIDENWKGDMQATHVHGVAGFVHAYAHLGSGLLLTRPTSNVNV